MITGSQKQSVESLCPLGARTMCSSLFFFGGCIEEIPQSGSYPEGIIAELTDPTVAQIAKKSTYLAGGMVMVNAQCPLPLSWAAADRTNSMLGREERLILTGHQLVSDKPTLLFLSFRARSSPFSEVSSMSGFALPRHGVLLSLDLLLVREVLGGVVDPLGDHTDPLGLTFG